MVDTGTYIIRQGKRRVMPKLARHYIDTGLFELASGGESVMLRLIGTKYVIIFPRAIEVAKQDIFWQTDRRPQFIKTYVHPKHLGKLILPFKSDSRGNIIRIPFDLIFGSVSPELVEKLAFYLDELPD